jgi:hypothetical protein
VDRSCRSTYFLAVRDGSRRAARIPGNHAILGLLGWLFRPLGHSSRGDGGRRGGNGRWGRCNRRGGRGRQRGCCRSGGFGRRWRGRRGNRGTRTGCGGLGRGRLGRESRQPPHGKQEEKTAAKGRQPEGRLRFVGGRLVMGVGVQRVDVFVVGVLSSAVVGRVAHVSAP